MTIFWESSSMLIEFSSRCYRPEQPVVLSRGAGEEVERVGRADCGAVSECDRPQPVDGDRERSPLHVCRVRHVTVRTPCMIVWCGSHTKWYVPFFNFTVH